ncbi:hypothetical protein N780_08340 [Pontibacillus chungwhensis BH030062]|uniref:Lipoprotein n=1 Tax=Pontibacillus chungwhensis BH030062 TaxID=1385513 RepID=A0A0A2UX49_9BACI|nr:hypothetical protein [Pontibacillus chungwhensis]KGP91308.1 hypothetical protein N780_08340 [Pontibacillus chungwhensis BH030062]
MKKGMSIGLIFITTILLFGCDGENLNLIKLDGEVYRAEVSDYSKEDLGKSYGKVKYNSPSTMPQNNKEATLFPVGTEIFYKKNREDEFLVSFKDRIYELTKHE